MAKLKRATIVLTCGCDNRIEIPVGRAGSEILCTRCRQKHQLRSLSRLKESGDVIEKEINIATSAQYSLSQLLLITVPFAALAWITKQLGVMFVITVSAGLLLFFALISFAWLIHYTPAIKAWFWDQVVDYEAPRNE